MNTLCIEPVSREEHVAALAEVVVGVRQEPGPVCLDVGEVRDEPGTVVLSERWRDEDVRSAPREVVLLTVG